VPWQPIQPEPKQSSWKRVQDIDEPSLQTAQDPAKSAWNRRLTLTLLRREAEELLRLTKPGDSSPP